MRVAIRADASVQIGTGHVMRCLTLAERLAARGAEVGFICRAHVGNLISHVEAKGFAVSQLPVETRQVAAPSAAVADWLGVTWQQDVYETSAALDASGERIDWLVADHYCLDGRWEKALRNRIVQLMVIDDLADREHDCDLLLDTGYYDNADERYRKLVPETCAPLLGPHYALLRQEFLTCRRNDRIRDGAVRRVLISFGGTDWTGETGKTLAALKHPDLSDLEVAAVVGRSNPRLGELQQMAGSLPHCTLRIDVHNMAELMQWADVAIGGGGTTTWERLYLGLPSMVVVQAENQIQQTESLARRELLINLGWHGAVSEERIRRELVKLRQKPNRAREMARQALALPVAERGVEAVCKAMEERAYAVA